jgi:prepilin signal peptidase PulO-like enzyme (type II secretory pathway)
LYFALWLVSGGRWVGFGDVKLGLGLGLLLGDWRLALLALFLANFIGTLLVLPGILTRKIGRGTQVPFGPLLIAGFAIALLYGPAFINFFDAASGWFAGAPLML